MNVTAGVPIAVPRLARRAPVRRTAQRLREQLIHGLLFLCGALSILTTAGIVAVLIFETIEFFGEVPLERFLTAVAELRPKVKALLVQLAPSYTLIRGEEELFEFLKSLPSEHRYAVEFRHGSWFNETVYEALRKIEVAMAWSEVQYTEPPPVVTTDFVYLRFIGDRSLKKLGWVQIDRTPEMKKWLGHLRSVEDSIDRAYVFFNNHFAGFGPASVNSFLQLAGLPPFDFGAVHAPDRGQKRLIDF